MKHSLLTITLLAAVAMPAHSQSWIDLTSEYVQNPDFADNNYSGWTFEGWAGSTATRVNAQEFWNGTWDFYQTITVPQAGTYRISVTGYFRPGDNTDDAVQAYENGTADTPCVLYANSDETPMASIYEAYFTSSTAGTWGYRNGRSWRYYPNTMETGVTLFNQGNYANSIETTVGADCQLRIGIRDWEWVQGNWVLFTGWKLEWWGKETAVTGIRLTPASTTVKQGQQVQLTATVIPTNATYKGIEFESSNTSVATVDADGLVSTHNVGTATITARSTHYTNRYATCTITVKANQVSASQVIINEVQQANLDMYIDPSFNYGGWIELYNSTDEDAALNGLYISDDVAELHKYALKSALQGSVPAGGFLTLWFDHNTRWSQRNIPFKLDYDGGSIYLSDSNGTILQQAVYPPAIARTSYARTTDGGTMWAYTDQPTPSATNASSPFATIRLAAPAVDVPSQLFSSSFTANVTIPAGATLRYTLDGTTPTLDNGSTSTTGRFSINSTTILRLRLFQDGYLSSPVVTRTFIERSRDYTLPVVSIVSDPANFTGEDYGIFVQGNGNGRPGNGQDAACNWNMAWDRPVAFDFFTADGMGAFAQEVNIEAAGGWSRAWTPYSFNIKANKIYEGQNRLDYQFFADRPFLRHKALKVRNGGNDTDNRIKDAAIQQVVSTSGLNVETQAYQPVHVFRNGQYIGVENLREPNNKNYGFAHYGIDTDLMDQWKMSPDSGYVQQTGDRVAWEELISLSATAADASSYERIKELLDIEEYINYMSVQLYIAGNDWPQNNVKAFRARSEGESNSRFRFVVFDTDGAFAYSNAFTAFAGKQWYTFDQLRGADIIAEYGNHIYAEIEFVTLFLGLLQNEEFKKQFADQFCIVAGSVFEPTRAAAVINAMVAAVNPAMSLEGRSSNWSANNVRSSLSSSRQTSSVSNMRSYLGLGTPLSVTLSANIAEAPLLVNGLEVPTRQFSGSLFAPAVVSTSVPAGYRFLGWQSSQSVTTTTLFAKASTWSYYDQGSLDNTSWQAAGYSAQSWGSGTAPLGYDTGNATKAAAYGTTLSYGGSSSNKYPTYYFRKQVTLSSAPAADDSFVLDWVADDGFVIYVNGTEAGRFLMDNTPSPTFYSFADTYANANPESGQLTLPTSLFRAGTNVIAVELHNNSASSTDIYWDAALLHNQSVSGSYASTLPDYELPSASSESITLKAVFEPLADGDAEAWDSHPIKINEVSGANDIFVNDYFKKNDWIELYNTTDEDINIAGMYLSDDLEDVTKFVVPASNGTFSTVVPAHGYLVVWADKLESLTQLHANFKIAKDSGSVVLTASDFAWSDVLTYCLHDGTQSVGLYPDGGTELYVMQRPTIGASNVLTLDATAWAEPQYKPVGVDGDMAAADMTLSYDGIRLHLHHSAPARVDIYNIAGQLVRTARVMPGGTLSMAELQAGIYVARATSGDNDATLKVTVR